MKHKVLFSLLFTTVTFSLHAQSRDSLAASDYARAEQYLYYNTAPLVDHAAVRPNWVTDDNFWFRDLTATGSNFIFVDAAKGSLTPAFNQENT